MGHSAPLLRFTTAGSVDDGKSTLIGRLLHDAGGAFDDQIEAVRQSKINRSSGTFDFSLLTDGLRAEREQGITIDVAYRYFATAHRKFIIADTPGHEQYTRNMATGASTAEVAVVLVDARKGVLPQSRRHAYISALLGIRHLLIAVNKMDLVDFDEAVFSSIREDFLALRPSLRDAAMTFIPVSALEGDNVVEPSARTPWYTGPPLLEFLETVNVASDVAGQPFRFPVQLVIRPGLDFRGFAGQIAAGRIAAGDEVLVLPSARRTRVLRIVTFDGDLAEAQAPMSVVLTLEDEIDLSRGGLIAEAPRAPQSSRYFESTLVWMHPDPLEIGRAYLLRHGPHEVQARVGRLLYQVDVDTLRHQPASGLALNEIGVVSLETTQPLAFDPYQANRATGAFVLIDPISNLTLAAGMIEGGLADPAEAARAARSVPFNRGPVTAAERHRRGGHRGAYLAVDPHSEFARALERRLFDHGADVILLPELVQPRHLLVDAGLLVLGPPAGMEPALGDDVEAVITDLESRGILDARDSFSAGEGI
jgi:sulfate adenylyltransferase subunit 1